VERFPYSLEYREGGRVLQYSAELSSADDVAIILFDEPRNTYWQPPHRDQPLTLAEQHPILVRVTAAVMLLGVRPIWETHPRHAERTDWPVIMAEVAALLRRAG
jgi:hypothetical protein